ncbi:uncharacterized protein LOC144629130 isoform X2 [Oculina patagonica]
MMRVLGLFLVLFFGFKQGGSRVSAENFGTNFTCLSSHMRMVLNLTQIPLPIEPESMHLNDNRCTATQINDTFVVFEIPFFACGSIADTDQDDLIVSNTVRWDPPGVPTYTKSFRSRITCRYPREQNLSRFFPLPTPGQNNRFDRRIQKSQAAKRDMELKFMVHNGRKEVTGLYSFKGQMQRNWEFFLLSANLSLMKVLMIIYSHKWFLCEFWRLGDENPTISEDFTKTNQKWPRVEWNLIEDQESKLVKIYSTDQVRKVGMRYLRCALCDTSHRSLSNSA